MGTAYIPLTPESAIPLPTGVAVLPQLYHTGTNITASSYSFDAAQDEGIQFSIPQLVAYTASSNFSINLAWYAATATVGDVVWGSALAAVTPGTDTQNVETDSWATETRVTGSHLGTTAQRLHNHTVTITNLDSAASGDYMVFRVIRRAGTDSGDTMAGDARLVGVTISYPTT